jgi:ketosteroid isomerase-like protein
VSRETVEIVRRVMEAEAQGDAAAIFALYGEDIEWDVSRAGGPAAGQIGTLRGHDGVRTWLRTWYEGFEDGAKVLATLCGAWTIRDGKVVRVAWFQDRQDALESAGLVG